MEFPPTPVGERKLSPSPVKNKKKLKKLTSLDMDDSNNTSHRNYETIEQLRVRLKQNYNEAKRQREKYLNLSPSRKKEADKSLNGFRSKTQHQPVFKNYKQKSEVRPKTNNVVTFHNEDSIDIKPTRSTEPAASERTTATTSDRSPTTTNTGTREIIPTVYLGSNPNSPSKSNLKKSSNYNNSSNNNNKQKTNNKQHQNFTSSSFNASDDRVKITTQTSALIEEMNTSGKWSNSNTNYQKKKLPEINHNDVESVLQNQNIDNSSVSGSDHNIKSSTDKNEVNIHTKTNLTGQIQKSF